MTTAIGVGDDMATGVVAQIDGKIVVAGTSQNGTYKDFAAGALQPGRDAGHEFGGTGKVTVRLPREGRCAAAWCCRMTGKSWWRDTPRTEPERLRAGSLQHGRDAGHRIRPGGHRQGGDHRDGTQKRGLRGGAAGGWQVRVVGRMLPIPCRGYGPGQWCATTPTEPPMRLRQRRIDELYYGRGKGRRLGGGIAKRREDCGDRAVRTRPRLTGVFTVASMPTGRHSTPVSAEGRLSILALPAMLSRCRPTGRSSWRTAPSS